MTQDPPNPEAQKPSASAWAPRSEPKPDDTPETPETPESATPDASSDAAPISVTPDTTSDNDVAETPADAVTEPAIEPVLPVTAATPEEPATTAPVQRKRSGVPAWLLLVAAIVPAVIVGLAVFFLVGGSKEEDSTAAAGVIDGLMRLGQADQSNITSFAGTLPPEFATDFPIYEDAKIVVSIAMASAEGTGYLFGLRTPDEADDVFAFYNDALDQGSWQVEVGRSSSEFTGLRFLRTDNIDVSGDVSLHRSALNDETAIYLSYTDISRAITPGGLSDPFVMGVSRPLPAGFPEEVPIFEGPEPSVVLDTYFERGQGGRAFIVSFLTNASQRDVIDYYRQEFEGRGWNVSEAGVASTSFAMGIEFDDGDSRTLSGSITADSFENDSSFTQVDLIVTTTGSR